MRKDSDCQRWHNSQMSGERGGGVGQDFSIVTIFYRRSVDRSSHGCVWTGCQWLIKRNQSYGNCCCLNKQRNVWIRYKVIKPVRKAKGCLAKIELMCFINKVHRIIIAFSSSVMTAY